MKKIGVITMHRVQNFGSVLQAYALSEKLNRLGADCEIIDYQYPNAFHLSSVSTVKRSFNIELFIRRIKYFILYRNSLQKKRFRDFLNSTLKTSRYYPTRQSLKECPPMYDVYITGSDQVWNPYCMKGDVQFSIRGLADCFAMMGGGYWFITSYICLYILSPVLNAFMDNTEKNTYRWVLIAFSFSKLYMLSVAAEQVSL